MTVMADIVRTETVGSRVTREDLEDLLATSRLSNVSPDDLSAQAKAAAVYASSDPPAAPLPGQVWWDMTWRLLRCYDDVSGLFCAIGPDRYEFPAVAGETLFRGELLRFDPDQTESYRYPVVCSLRSFLDSYRCIGTASETASAFGFVRVGWWGYVDAFLAATSATYSVYAPYYVDWTNPKHLRVIAPYTYPPDGKIAVARQIEFHVAGGDLSSLTSCPRIVEFTGPFRYNTS